MSEDDLRPHLNPRSFLTDPVHVFDEVAVPLPPGTKAPPRPPGEERVPGSELPVTEPFEIFDCQAIPLPPGTKAPPRPPGKERPRTLTVAVPGGAGPAGDAVAELLRRVQDVVDGLAHDPNGLDAIRNATDALPRAG